MKTNGLQKAGYTLINVGGNGHDVGAATHGGKPLNCSAPASCFIAKRNSTGFYQIDPARFPGPGSSAACLNDTQLAACLAKGAPSGDGPRIDPSSCGCRNGNEGMLALAQELRAQGYTWGSYSAMGGCDNAECDVPALAKSKANGFVREDYELFVKYWGSAYVMVDAVADRDPQPGQMSPGPRGSQGKFLLDEWNSLIKANSAKRPPVVLHSCHVACSANYFAGPTLEIATCNASDSKQHFSLGEGIADAGDLSDGSSGLCAGCLHVNIGCGNTALKSSSGLGYGMSGGCSETGGFGDFYRNSSLGDRIVSKRSGGCLGLVNGTGRQVVLLSAKQCNFPAAAVSQGWTRGLTASVSPYSLLKSAAQHGKCLSARPGGVVPPDPWCSSSVNMWRSNTDSLPVWGRIQDELESLVGLGTVSRPGSWAFPDYLQIGVPMVGSFTWEETKTVLSIWAVCSSPLILSNDVRPGRVQQRILDLATNAAMLRVNQQYCKKFAGDRIWTAPFGQELWGKPLANDSAAVVLFNRRGEPCTASAKFNPWHRNVTCGNGGFKCSVNEPIDAPCDDVPALSMGAQNMSLDYSVLPSWLGDGASNADLECDLFDVFATAAQGKALGRFRSRQFNALVPPHGSRFLVVSNCEAAAERVLNKTDDEPVPPRYEWRPLP